MARSTSMVSLALGAVRSELRRKDEKPEQVSADEALKVLDDLARSEPDLLAAQWYQKANDSQIKAFRRSWKKWATEYLV